VRVKGREKQPSPSPTFSPSHPHPSPSPLTPHPHVPIEIKIFVEKSVFFRSSRGISYFLRYPTLDHCSRIIKKYLVSVSQLLFFISEAKNK
jgi:hypothetical protein